MHDESAPTPGVDGAWGLVERIDGGQPSGVLLLYPAGNLDVTLDLQLTTPTGIERWTQGPYALVDGNTPLEIAVDLPATVPPGVPSVVQALATATVDDRVVGRSAVRMYATGLGSVEELHLDAEVVSAGVEDAEGSVEVGFATKEGLP